MGMRGLAAAVSRWLHGPDFGHDTDGAMHWAESAEQLAIAEEQREVWEPFGECGHNSFSQSGMRVHKS